MKKLLHILLGRGEHDDKILEESSQEAHHIKSKITQDLIDIMKEVDMVNKQTRKSLTKISKRIGDVGEQIAVMK